MGCCPNIQIVHALSKIYVQKKDLSTSHCPSPVDPKTKKLLSKLNCELKALKQHC